MTKATPKPISDPLMFYTDPALGAVLTVPEVMAMWGISRRTVEMAFWKGKLSARKTVSGGAILVTRASAVKLWGNPRFDLTDDALLAGEFDNPIMKGGK